VYKLESELKIQDLTAVRINASENRGPSPDADNRKLIINFLSSDQETKHFSSTWRHNYVLEGINKIQ